MNFSEGTIVQSDGLRFTSKTEGLNLKIKSSHADKIKNHLNKNLWIGIRPEDIYDAASTQQRESFEKVEAVLEVVEPMGNEIFLYFPAGGSQMVARIPAREKPEAGSNRTLYFDTEKIHFFDAATEEAIK